MTPAHRDRALDGLRALAILGVVLGHWLVAGLVVGADGALGVQSPLTYLGALAPVSWLLQMLGLFFLVGGYSSARSYRRFTMDNAPGCGYFGWVRGRTLRLVRPVVAVLAAVGAALPLLGFIGVPAGTLRTTVVLLLQPLWFIAVYTVITALTPLAIALDRRLRGWSALPALLLVAAVDVLRYGPWAQAVPGWVGWVNVLPGWAFGFLLGVAWAAGRISRRMAAVLAAGGLVLALLLVRGFGYPASLVGVPGDPRINSHPPSLLVLAVGAAQSGAAILLHGRIGRLLRRPGLWAPVALLNLRAMTIFCWHQVALMLITIISLALHPAGLFGLQGTPESMSWVLHRLAWLPVHLVTLSGLVAIAHRFEQPWRARLPARAVWALFTVSFAMYAVGVW